MKNIGGFPIAGMPVQNSEQASDLSSLTQGSPTNWGRWGRDDDVGALNFLTNSEVLRAIKSVKQGRVFGLGLRLGDPAGDPQPEGRFEFMRLSVRDRASYVSGKSKTMQGGLEATDDMIIMRLHNSTHLDSLGHTWYGGLIWNGYDASTTTDQLTKGSILPIAERCIVGRGVLLDIAGYKKVPALTHDDEISLDDILSCAKEQAVDLEKHDILIIRTGWIGRFYKEGGKAWFGRSNYDEPGITHRKELIEWFHEMEIPVLGCDTLSNEKPRHPGTGIASPLSISLSRNLGVIFNERMWLEDLTSDCVKDQQWSFLYAASALKIVGASGSPVNPIAIK